MQRSKRWKFTDRIIVGFFNNSCSENAVKQCEELAPSSFGSEGFDAEELDQYCRYFSDVV